MDDIAWPAIFLAGHLLSQLLAAMRRCESSALGSNRYPSGSLTFMIWQTQVPTTRV